MRGWKGQRAWAAAMIVGNVVTIASVLPQVMDAGTPLADRFWPMVAMSLCTVSAVGLALSRRIWQRPGHEG